MFPPAALVSLYSPPRSIWDPSEALIWLMAVATVVGASYWAAWEERGSFLSGDRKQAGPHDVDEDAPLSLDITLKAAVAFVGINSAVLLLLFFFMTPWFFFALLGLFTLAAMEVGGMRFRACRGWGGGAG